MESPIAREGPAPASPTSGARSARWALQIARCAIPGVVCAGVLGLALLLCFYRLGEGSLYDWDEAIYAQAAREMLLSNVWGTLSWDGSPFFHKPPLYFWLTALSYDILGVDEFAARLWPASFGFGVVVLTFFLGVRLHSWPAGAGAAVLLLIVDQHYYSQWWNFLSLTRTAMLDIPLTFWVTLTCVLVWEAERRPWLLALTGIPLGLAVMTKAWPGLLAALIPFVYQCGAGRLGQEHRSGRMAYWGVAGLLAGVLILPWHLWEHALYGALFWREYGGSNLMGRVFEVVEEHLGGPLFYLDVIRQGFSIWGFLGAPAYLWTLWRGLGQGDRRALLLLSWITVPLLLFSLAQTKLGWYIALVYPPVALMLAVALAQLLTARVAFGVVAAVTLLCCIRLPTPADGSPDVKEFAPSVERYVVHAQVLYVVQPACPTPGASLTAGRMLLAKTHVRAALRFYLNRPLICIEEREVLSERPLPEGYVVSDRASWHRFAHRGRIVVDGEKYILAQWN